MMALGRKILPYKQRGDKYGEPGNPVGYEDVFVGTDVFPARWKHQGGYR